MYALFSRLSQFASPNRLHATSLPHLDILYKIRVCFKQRLPVYRRIPANVPCTCPGQEICFILARRAPDLTPQPPFQVKPKLFDRCRFGRLPDSAKRAVGVSRRASRPHGLFPEDGRRIELGKFACTKYGRRWVCGCGECVTA